MIKRKKILFRILMSAVLLGCSNLVGMPIFTEIDNIVHIKGQADAGSFVSVKIEDANEYELIGHLV